MTNIHMNLYFLSNKTQYLQFSLFCYVHEVYCYVENMHKICNNHTSNILFLTLTILVKKFKAKKLKEFLIKFVKHKVCTFIFKDKFVVCIFSLRRNEQRVRYKVAIINWPIKGNVKHSSTLYNMIPDNYIFYIWFLISSSVY